MSSLDLTKLSAFLANGSTPRTPQPIDVHYLNGFKWNTIVSYNAAVKKFVRFKTERNELPFTLPVTAEDIYQFCFWAGRNESQQTTQEVKATTVEKYLYGIQAWHKYHSAQYPKESKTKVNTLLKSSAKVDAQVPPKPKKAAVHLKHLLILVQALTGKGEKEEAVKDLAITAFWGMARLAELTYPNESGPITRASSLLTSDAQTTNTDQQRVTWLTLRNAKTCGPGKSQEIQLKEMGTELCPVGAIERRLANAKGADTSLFGFRTDKGRHHLTRNTVISTIKKVWTDTVISTIKKVWTDNNLEGLSGHSFRVGGASLRFALGVPVEEICSMGRWTSSCYKLYIRPYSKSEVAESKALLKRLVTIHR
ncbi:hypothetical protein PGT21_011625 [Puccinia graminis f. sp. tritici]|uniref:Tyr recombinase domain-containing protein n=1 Tax=Puccinia graminis f. sp. tritici TaxID=56615 RepID=A0A5B0S6A8_PUCGR|nr:hypothetical protein PGT21_011625 [Puccinia graminis f. sp. tritici]KAA1132144.1 hypothetical protein PGTUg99_037430 [Puccinia graminis f. sp. tritici]